MATRLLSDSPPAVPDLDGSLLRFEGSLATDTEALDKETATHFATRLTLYRTPPLTLALSGHGTRRLGG